MEPEDSLPQSQQTATCPILSQRIGTSPRPCEIFHDWLCDILAATLHIGGSSSICNLRTRHAVVTGINLSPAHIKKGQKNNAKRSDAYVEK